MTSEEYGEAYKRGFERTLRVLLAAGANLTQANDVAQDAWDYGLEHLGRLREKERVIEWVNSIARHLLTSKFRRQRLLCSLSAAYDRGIEPTVNLPAIEVNRALSKCSKRQQKLLKNVYMHGFETSEIAKRSGKSRGSIHSRLSRARAALRKHMGHSAETPNDGRKRH